MKTSLVFELHRITVGLPALLLVGCVGNLGRAHAAEGAGAGWHLLRAASRQGPRPRLDDRKGDAGARPAGNRGDGRATPGRGTYVVTYVDKWMWDMRMYLCDLRIELRDARDQSILGYGQSMQSSLKAMGQTPEDVINRALDQLFAPGT